MGFTCGLYVAPKYKDTTIDEIRYITDYYSYENNQWAKDHFGSPKEYATYLSQDKIKEMAQDKLNYYKQFVHKDEFNYTTITDGIDTWCSNGSHLHNAITCGEYVSETIMLDKERVLTALTTLWEELDKLLPKEAWINHAYRSKYDEETDDEIITLFNVDGVEVTDEDGNISRIYNNEECPIGFSEYWNDWSGYGIVTAIKALEKILATVDFETQICYYNGGW